MSCSLAVLLLSVALSAAAGLNGASFDRKNAPAAPFVELSFGADGVLGPLMSNGVVGAQRDGNTHREQAQRRLRTERYIADPLVSSPSVKAETDFDYGLQLHRCRDTGEAYSASYLIHREHLELQHTAYNLTWVNCEMGSFIMMNGRAAAHRHVNGTVFQSIDVLDFSVIHLSAFERLQQRWSRSSPLIQQDRNNLTSVFRAAEELREHTLRMRERDSHKAHPAFDKTVVVMPFLGSDMGAGHSKLVNRQAYLHACFWSFYEHYSHVVAAVKSPKDAYFIRNMSGLPFYDVMLLENLPKSASLPVATVQETKRRITSGQWPFDYMFFTESDQILMMRIPDLLYSYLDTHRRHLTVPHRLMAYPESVVVGFHKRSVARNEPYDWMAMQCCLTRQYCTDRKEWTHVSNTSVPIVQIYHIQVPLGNSDFHRENFRGCKLRASNEVGYCP